MCFSFFLFFLCCKHAFPRPCATTACPSKTEESQIPPPYPPPASALPPPPPPIHIGIVTMHYLFSFIHKNLSLTNHFFSLFTLHQSNPPQVYGSSWVFHSLKIFHARYAVANVNNRFEQFSGKCCPNPRVFHQNVKPFLDTYVLDPDAFKEKNSPYHATCIPIGIALKILISVEKKMATTISKRDVSKILHLINFHHLVEYRGNEQPFIPLKNFRELEKSNSPIPLRLTQYLPYLSNYQGISLNLFRIDLSQTNDQNKAIHIFPRYLSEFHSSEQHFQIDLIEDQPNLWAETFSNNHSKPKPPSQHVLAVPNFIQFLYRNNRKYQKHNFRDCKYVCRICQNLYKTYAEFEHHKTVCLSFPTGARVSKRRAKNRIISHHLTNNIFTGKTEVSGLTFKRGELHKLLVPLTLSSCDIEAFLHDSTGLSHPTNAEKIHSVFAYALAHSSLHNHLPLPQNLSCPRGMCYNPSTESETDFMLSFLLTLRDDAKKLSNFINDAFELDPGPPIPNKNFTPEDKLKWNLSTRCIFCGNKFYSFRFKRIDVRAVSTFRRFSIVKSKERVLPTRDHAHLQLSSKLQA